MLNGASLAGIGIAAAVTIGGTVITDALWSGDPLNLIKLGASWLLLGALLGRIYYNIRTPRPVAAPAD